MKKFTVVGLAGTGKSSVTSHIAQEENLTVHSTDEYFAEVRADITHPVTVTYMENFEKSHDEVYDVSILNDTAKMIDRYGNDTFRDYEEQTIVWMYKGSDMMKNAIPDLGGAAFMRQNTRQTLKEEGVASIYLDASPDFISKNLAKDYETYKITRKSARGNYMQCAEQAEARNESVVGALKDLSEQHRTARVQHYRKADARVYMEDGDSITTAAQKVRGAVEGLELRELSIKNRRYARMGA